MDINNTINEMLSEEKGLKKLVRKVVYKSVGPLFEKSIEEFGRRLSTIEKNYNEEIAVHNSRISNLEVNIRNNNDIIKGLQAELSGQSVEIKRIMDYSLNLGEEVKKSRAVVAGTTETLAGEICDNKKAKIDETSESSYTGIDYFDFENRFRGSRDHIKKVQEQYLEYFKGRKNVVDIGCGRGEFLEMLKENNIGAVGIDLYGKSIECCKMIGLNVKQEDAISYLQGSESVDGIFAGQLVEHLSTGQIIQLCETAYDKLEEGGYMILETPNPTSLAIYTHAFYMDPSHGKPVHPLTLQYYAEKAGFKDVKILYTKSSLLPVSIPKLEGQNIENINEFNEAMAIVSETLFGSQDYAIIAKK